MSYQHQHDHEACITSAMTLAESRCAARGVNLTAQRRQVLALVWRSHRPIGAYEILDALSAIDGKTVAPPTVYRALDFLAAHGLIHRVESLNAFIGCQNPKADHAAELFLCRSCGSAFELDHSGVSAAIHAMAKTVGFSIDHQTIEITGQCRDCSAGSINA